MGRIPSDGGGGAKFTYSRGTNPLDDDTITVAEGNTWYVTASDGSHSFEQGNVVVYDGANWNEYTVDDHSEIGGVSSDQHHRRTQPLRRSTDDLERGPEIWSKTTNESGSMGDAPTYGIIDTVEVPVPDRANFIWVRADFQSHNTPGDTSVGDVEMMIRVEGTIIATGTFNSYSTSTGAVSGWYSNTFGAVSSVTVETGARSPNGYEGETITVTSQTAERDRQFEDIA